MHAMRAVPVYCRDQLRGSLRKLGQLLLSPSNLAECDDCEFAIMRRAPIV